MYFEIKVVTKQIKNKSMFYFVCSIHVTTLKPINGFIYSLQVDVSANATHMSNIYILISLENVKGKTKNG